MSCIIAALKFVRNLMIVSSCTLLLLAISALGSFVAATEIGANKFDLLLQYLPSSEPSPQAGDGSHYIRRAMAKKAISDAHDAGFAFLRVAVTGFFPVIIDDHKNDLALWQNNPTKFWAATDEMFDDLDRAGIRLVPTLAWNFTQFPALGRDKLTTFLQDPKSRSRQLLAQFIRDFISRYRQRQTILFYELTNELNLSADVEIGEKCKQQKPTTCVWSNFTTNDLLEFSTSTAPLIKSLDASRPLSSGFAIPRPAAMHLMRRPQFSTSGPDWTADDREEFQGYILAIHKPFDVVSVHLYPTKENVRFGKPDGQQYELVSEAAAAARSEGKPIFVGEFGDVAGRTPFMTYTVDKIVNERVDFAAIWVWEFYQTSTYQTRNTDPTKYSVEPGYSEDLIQLLIQTERRVGQRLPETSVAAPPRVVLTWPLPCALISGPVNLAAVASDGIKAVRQVEFFINGKMLAAVGAPPYFLPFDPAGFNERTATITARAVTQSGAYSEFQSQVRVNADTTACTVPQ